MSARISEKNMKRSKDRFAYEQEIENENWFANGLHRFIIVFSVMWFGIVAVYITKFLGWDTLFSLMPNEFSGFMAGITLPLAIVWVIMAYIDRGSSFKRETQMLRDSLNQVIFPDSNGSEATKMIADAIKSQVAELKDTTKDVCAQSDVIKRDLTERVTELKELASMDLEDAKEKLPKIEEELKILLIPKDPNDDSNVICEIRSGAGGDHPCRRRKRKEGAIPLHKRSSQVYRP